MVSDKEQSTALRSLDGILGELESLLDSVPIDHKVEAKHQELRNEAAVLYGRVSGLVPGGSISRFGQPRDVVQTVLGNPSIGGLVELDTTGLYYECLVFFRSLVQQALGRAEEMERQRKPTLSPEVAARWAWLILPLERIRRALTAHPQFLVPLLQRIEGWPAYRTVAVIATVGGFLVTMAAIIAVIGVAVALLI